MTVEPTPETVERLWRIAGTARDALWALALTYTSVPSDGSRPHWCDFTGRHDPTCTGMLAIVDTFSEALDALDATTTLTATR